MQKKILIWVITVVVLIAILGVVSFMVSFSKDNNPVLSTCEEFPNKTSIFNDGEVEDCDCLIDEAQANQCKNDLNDRDLFNQAVYERDIDVCNQIQASGMANSCKKLTQAGIDEFVEEKNRLLEEQNINNQEN
jgi:hypothetical protein